MLTRIAHSISKGIEKFELLLNYLSVLIISAMVFLGTADVIARYIFNSPIKGALEMNALLLGGATFLIIGYVQAKKSNITLELFINRYPPRARRVVDMFVLLVTLTLFVLIAWQSCAMAIRDITSGRLIENIYVPLYPFEFLLTFGASMVALETLIQIVRLVSKRTETVA